MLELIEVSDPQARTGQVRVRVKAPPTMSWPEAGVLTASGQTAYTALDALDIQAGDTLLIHAAAGGVGSFAVQLAVVRGALVVGTASERNHDYLRSLGATPVTYGPGLADLTRLYTEGQLVIEVASTVPLGNAAEAHRLVETGHVRGKVALVTD